MKRMILVPEDAYARFEQKQKLETSVVAVVVEPIPKTMRPRATAILNRLKETGRYHMGQNRRSEARG